MIRTNLKLIAIIVTVMGLFSFSIKKKDKGIEVINKLIDLEYFKYVDSDKEELLKNDLIESYNSYKILSTISDDITLLPYDYRLYFCDGEALFEVGGIEEYLGYAKHAFEKRGLSLNWSNEISDQNENHWNHRITVNEKEYVLFEGSMDRTNEWGIAQLNYYELLNDQLKIQGCNERIYPISGGEDGQFIILSEDQYNYISTTFYQGKDFNKWEIPYPVDKWKEINGLK